MKKSFYYAFLIPKTGESGVTSVWAECEKKVVRVAGAKFKRFQTLEDAKLWLDKIIIACKSENKIKKSFYYAFLIPKTKESGVVATWAECEAKVKSVNGARFQKFENRREAEIWLNAGAEYEKRERREKIKLEDGIYFDSGTGRGEGVEISVTDKNGKNLLHKVIDEKDLNAHGKHHAGHEATNNYGELLALKYAIQIAKKTKQKKIFGDSKLVIEYWSMGIAKAKDLPAKTTKLIFEVTALREMFEEDGGNVLRIPGGDNPADLGFHRG